MSYNLHMSLHYACFPAGQSEATSYECLRQDPVARCLSPTKHTCLWTFLHSLLSLANMGENSCVVGFPWLSMDHWLCILEGNEAKARPYLFPKFVFHLSHQFSLTKVPIDLGENKRERHRPNGITEREGFSSQKAWL